jgi:hypothetical protein
VLSPNEGGEFVFRAVRSKSWIRSGINANAFRRRPERDLHGLSVDYTYAAVGRLQTCHGVIKINVAKLEAFGFRIERAGDHANIREVPYDTKENYSEVLRCAEALVTCSEIVTDPADS